MPCASRACRRRKRPGSRTRWLRTGRSVGEGASGPRARTDTPGLAGPPTRAASWVSSGWSGSTRTTSNPTVAHHAAAWPTSAHLSCRASGLSSGCSSSRVWIRSMMQQAVVATARRVCSRSGWHPTLARTSRTRIAVCSTAGSPWPSHPRRTSRRMMSANGPVSSTGPSSRLMTSPDPGARRPVLRHRRPAHRDRPMRAARHCRSRAGSGPAGRPRG